MRTIDYADFEDRFISAIGVAPDTAILTAETDALKRSLNDRIRSAWTRAKWPELIRIVSKTVAAVDVATLKADKAVQIASATDLFDVYAVWDKPPFEEPSAQRVDFYLIDGYLVLPADNDDTTVYVVGSQVPASDYGTGTTTLPAFLEHYLLAAGLADYYRSGGQNEKAVVEEARAEEYLLREIDRAERLQQQNRVVIGQYQSPWPTLRISQATI